MKNTTTSTPVEVPVLFGERPPTNPNPYSHIARQRIAPKAGTQRAAVLECLQEAATDDEGAERLGISPNSWRPRRDELVKSGLVVRVGTGKSASGNPAARWQAKARVGVQAGGGAADLWSRILDRRPPWMSRRHLERLIAEAAAANGGNTAAALRQVARDLEALR